MLFIDPKDAKKALEDINEALKLINLKLKKFNHVMLLEACQEITSSEADKMIEENTKELDAKYKRLLDGFPKGPNQEQKD